MWIVGLDGCGIDESQCWGVLKVRRLLHTIANILDTDGIGLFPLLPFFSFVNAR